ncbi:MAG: FtsQ-type POTRA domain-containing protein [bacterium]
MSRRKQHVVLRKKKRMHRRKTAKKFIFGVLIAACTAGVLYILFDMSYALFFSSAYFKILEIEIQGTSTEETEQIKERLTIKEGDNIFAFRAKDVVHKLQAARPEIKDVIIKRELPRRVVLNLTHREPIALIAYGSKMFCVDEENVMFRLPILDQKLYLKKMFLPEVIAAGEIERNVLIKFLKLLKSMDQGLGQDILKLHTDIPLDIICYLNDGTKIVWGELSEDDFKIKYDRMLTVYMDAKKKFNKIRYLNMRCWEDGRVLIRPRGIDSDEEQY